MLIYNFQKEFIGIDEADLDVFGFANLSELKAEASDFADMFVRTPGYIHNFKHVHWIDFVTCADPSEDSKVIIEVNSKTYKASIDIKTIYLSDNPTSKAYLISLNNLRSLTIKENGEFSEDISKKKPPRIEPTVGHAFNISDDEDESTEIQSHVEMDGFKPFEDIQDSLNSEEISETQEIKPTVPLDISFDDDEEEIQEPIIQVTPSDEDIYAQDTEVALEDDFEIDAFKPEPTEDVVAVVTTEKKGTIEDDYDYSYSYDPQVASDELGLPIDLIEEFIQDFIAQAKEFKDELYSSSESGDLENIQVLSHKLKGVAANLRIEDAFNTLSIINTSSDETEIKSYLNIFYNIIAKLSGEEIQVSKVIEPTALENDVEAEDDLYADDLILDFKQEESQEKEEEIQIEEDNEDDLILDFKDENSQEETKEEEIEIAEDDDLDIAFDIDVKDSEVPEKIEMPELADDEFLNEDEEDEVLEDIDELLLDTAEDIEYIQDESKETTEEVVPEIEYSKNRVANEIGLDQESFDELFKDYIIDSTESTTLIHDAITQQEYTQCSKEALKLKGMSNNMRITAFNEELDTLINSSDENELIQAMKKIDAVIAQISK